MTDYYLVATSHHIDDTDERLLSQSCEEEFRRTVDPLITDHSIVFCEGLWRDSILKRTQPEYRAIHNALVRTTASPDLGCFDHRQKELIEHPELIEPTLRSVEHWARSVHHAVRVAPYVVPDSLDGIIETIRKGPPHAQLLTRPSSEDVRIAKWISMQTRKFDRVFLEAMHKHGRHYDRCFFIGGTSHVIAMAQKCPYRVIDLTPAVEKPEIFEAHLADYYWSRLYINPSPRH